MVRPSMSSTTSASSVTETRCARGSPTSIGDDEVLIPFPQQELSALHYDPFKRTKFRGPEPTAAGEPDRVEPKLGPLRISLHVDVRWLVPVGRVKEEAIRTSR